MTRPRSLRHTFAMPPATHKKPSSPCTGICVLDAASGLCCGCGRTGAEIGAWGGMSEASRVSVMAGLGARMRDAGLDPAAVRPKAAAR